MDKIRMKNNLLELCKVPSISETSGELLISQKLYDMLSEMNYFQMNSKHLYHLPISGDPYGRSFVAGLLRGNQKSSKTVILLSHYDVVAVEDYGSLKEHAFDPEKYTELLKSSNINLPEEARKDLASGDYLFGRGTMDMKFGIALDIEILHEVSKDLENFPGNILFLSVPDEEASSVGMLGAIEFLNQLKQKESLDYKCCIVSEPHFPAYEGDTSNYIYTGTVGKLLPVFYCIGKETHAGEPFAALNPNLLTAKLIEKIEQNPELCEQDRGCTTPAPVCLKSADTKTEYSVQTPTTAYAYFNLVTLKKTPIEIMDKLKSIATEAFEDALAEIKKKAVKWSEVTGDKLQLPKFMPTVITYSELLAQCKQLHGSSILQHMENFVKSSKLQDPRQLSIETIKELCKFSPHKDPMIVVFFAPPYYPSCSGIDHYPILDSLSKDIIQRAKTLDVELLQQPYFTGLSDMSYLGLPGSLDASAVASDFPVWGSRYSLPLEAMAELNIPFINLGPLGKDAHKYTERLCISYSFDKTAQLVLDTVMNIVLDKI